MAVKQIAIDEVSTKELSSLENEINLLRSFRHPNIVRYIGTEVTPVALSIFLEYVPGGSLKALIDKFGQLEESVAKSYTRQVRNGIIVLYCTVLYCTVLYCTVLYCTVLYCTVLFCFLYTVAAFMEF